MMTFHEFEQLVEKYNEKHTKFHIENEEYLGNFTRPILNSRNICIGHIKKTFEDNILILRSYSSIPEIKEEILNFLEDFKFKHTFLIPCDSRHLYVYVAKLEGLK